MHLQLKKLIPAVFLFAASALAQVSYSTITGTVNDPNGNPLANASLTASLVNAQGYPVSSTVTPNGQPFNGSPAYGTLDSTGHFSINLAPNGILSKPSGTQWKVTITSPNDFAILTYAPPWAINYQFTVTGNADISTPLSALANPVAFFNTKTGQSTLKASGALPAGPAFACNFANSSVTNFQGDFPGCNIVPSTHSLTSQILNGVRNAASYQTGGGNNGIANAAAANQTVIADPGYGSTEQYSFRDDPQPAELLSLFRSEIGCSNGVLPQLGSDKQFRRHRSC